MSQRFRWEKLSEKIEQSNQNSVMDEEFVKNSVMDEQIVKNSLMDAKIDPEVVMDQSIFSFGGWNIYSPAITNE